MFKVRVTPQMVGRGRFMDYRPYIYFTEKSFLRAMRWQETRRLMKFMTVGASGFALNLGFLYFFTDIAGLFYMLSAIIVFAIVESYQYLANNFFTFHDRRVKNHVVGGSKYMAVLAIYNITYLAMLAGFTEILGIYYLLSSALAVGIAFVPKYLLCWRWVWKS